MSKTLETLLDALEADLGDARRFLRKGDKPNALAYLRSTRDYAIDAAAEAEEEFDDESDDC